MGRDKALLEFRRTTFLGRIITLLSPRVEPLVIVLGHHADAIRQVIPSGPRVVVNTNYKAGMLTSLQAGIRALPREAEAALFTLVDHPAVAEEDGRAPSSASGRRQTRSSPFPAMTAAAVIR